ncbi:hypothetical protein EJ02DRAFT_41943 [Clathrospora elynae]|uniref:Uncharacterized protein n=1 Tax=Clathrospora elynae TaxID=706981 RepID=A0A6A5SE59_9PLEO|nr:hypothetical protein EJ02DRAFT_41943 [Clathrospora elynae]
MTEQPLHGELAYGQVSEKERERGARCKRTEGQEAGFIKRSTLRSARCTSSCTVCKCIAIVIDYV